MFNFKYEDINCGIRHEAIKKYYTNIRHTTNINPEYRFSKEEFKVDVLSSPEERFMVKDIVTSIHDIYYIRIPNILITKEGKDYIYVSKHHDVDTIMIDLDIIKRSYDRFVYLKRMDTMFAFITFLIGLSSALYLAYPHFTSIHIP